MKRTPLLLVIVLFSVFKVMAQLTLTSSIIPQNIALTYNNVNTSGTTVSPGAGGTGVTWDFSGLPWDSTATTYNYSVPSNTPYPTTYNPANIAAISPDGFGDYYYDYYYSTSSIYQIIGHVQPNGSSTSNFYTKYSDYETVVTFPLQYGDSLADTFYGTVELTYGTDTAQKDYRTGHVYTKVDGSGTLMLPGNISMPALRLKINRTTSDTTADGYSAGKDSSLSYAWYSPNYPGELLVIGYTPDIFFSTIDTVAYYQSISSITGIKEPAVTGKTFTVYPNPASDVVNISYSLQKSSTVTILVKDLIANTVLTVPAQKQTVGEHTVTLSLNSIKQGIYIIELSTDEETLTQKLTKL